MRFQRPVAILVLIAASAICQSTFAQSNQGNFLGNVRRQAQGQWSQTIQNVMPQGTHGGNQVFKMPQKPPIIDPPIRPPVDPPTCPGGGGPLPVRPPVTFPEFPGFRPPTFVTPPVVGPPIFPPPVVGPPVIIPPVVTPPIPPVVTPPVIIPAPPIATVPTPGGTLPVVTPPMSNAGHVWLKQPTTGEDASLCAYFALYHFYNGLDRSLFMQIATNYYQKELSFSPADASTFVRQGNDPALLQAFGLQPTGSAGWSKDVVIVADIQAGHFYTVRKIGSSWWSFDSFNLSQPTSIGSVSDGPPKVVGQIWSLQ